MGWVPAWSLPTHFLTSMGSLFPPAVKLLKIQLPKAGPRSRETSDGNFYMKTNSTVLYASKVC